MKNTKVLLGGFGKFGIGKRIKQYYRDRGCDIVTCSDYDSFKLTVMERKCSFTVLHSEWHNLFTSIELLKLGKSPYLVTGNGIRTNEAVCKFNLADLLSTNLNISNNIKVSQPDLCVI